METSNGTVEVNENSIEEGLAKEAIDDVIRWDRAHRSLFILFNVLRVVTGFLGVAAACFLIYLILRFKTLRKWVNFYIASLALCHLAYCIGEPILGGTLALALNSNWLPARVVRYTWTLADLAYFLLTVIAFLLGVQPCLETIAPSLAAFQRKWCKVTLAALGCLYLVLFGISFCIPVYVISEFASRFYIAVFVVVVGINIALCFCDKSDKASDCLLVCNIAIFCHSLYMFYILLIEFFFMKSAILRAFTTFTKIIPRAIANLMTVVILWRLIEKNRYFRHAYRSVWGRRADDDAEKSMDGLIDDE